MSKLPNDPLDLLRQLAQREAADKGAPDPHLVLMRIRLLRAMRRDNVLGWVILYMNVFVGVVVLVLGRWWLVPMPAYAIVVTVRTKWKYR